MISLCVPTKDRPEFLGRLLRYYASTGYAHWILIGDSSGPAQAAENRRLADALSGRLRVVHRAFPGLSSCACLEQLSRQVSTPYCAFLGDDDVLCTAGLDRCIEFLERHPDYGAAHGRGLLFQTEQNRPVGVFGNMGSYPQAALESETGAERLQEHLTVSLHALLNSVHRTQTWQAMFQGLGAMAGVANRNIFKDELIASGVSAIRGKVKALDVLYLARQAHDTYRFPHIFDWITSPEWFPSYEIFHRRLVEELVRQDGLSVGQARAVVSQIAWGYLARVVGDAWRQDAAGRSRRPPSRLRAMAKRIPWARSGWRAVRRLTQRWRDDLSLPALLDPSSPYHAEFMPFYQAVTAPPASRAERMPLPQETLEGAGASREAGA